MKKLQVTPIINRHSVSLSQPASLLQPILFSLLCLLQFTSLNVQAAPEAAAVNSIPMIPAPAATPVADAAAAPAAVPIPAAPEVAASSYVLIDAASGQVLVEKNSHQRLPPASLTKLMTAYIVERELANHRLQMTDQVPISVNAWRTGGSRMFVREGTEVAAEQLLKGVIIQSGNDASVALAEHIAGAESAFADLMNQQAALLGMQDTHFMNATGLPHEQHFSSAFDLATLARAIIVNYPENYKLYSEKYFLYNDIRQPNRNLLLWRDASVDGLKTGHTEEAGYCLVTSAVREGMRLIAVVMGTSSENARAQESQKLLNYGFRYFITKPLFKSGESVATSPVWKGVTNQLQLGLADDLVVTTARGDNAAIESLMDIRQVIKAPIAQGDQLGTLTIRQGDTILAQRPLVALEAIEEGGFFKRLWDSIRLFFAQLFG